MVEGEMTENEADAAWLTQRGVEKELRALHVAWNQNLDDGDVAFEDMPQCPQLEVYKLSRDESDGIITARQRREEILAI